MIELELEKTYLVSKLPKGVADFPHKEIMDMYIPADDDHPVLRLRKKGDSFEITKKQPIKEGDASAQEEHTIRLSQEEFNTLATINGKKARKIRYAYLYKGIKAEIDVFQDDLAGLVLADVEFDDAHKKDSFMMPDFCLVDVTQDKTLAGGMLCGKKYSDIKSHLDALGYTKVAY